jgi:diguanylate cyclase (GGDEF)-like protein
MRKNRDPFTETAPSVFTDFKYEEAATSAVDQALGHARHAGELMSVILCDLDHLEAINAIHGRASGDALLLQVFVRVCELVPVEDVIWESERADLVILARNHACVEAYHLAENIRQRIAEQLFQVAQKQVMLTVSLGIRTSVPDSLVTADELLSLAEDQLELGKRNGPNAIAPTIN